LAEQLSNNAQTTIVSGLNNTTTPVTFVVANAAAFPATGNFRVLVEAEILLVTVRSGTSFTATRAQEGTAAVAHANGATVTHVLTAGGLQQIVADGVASARPAAFVTLTYGPTIGVPDAGAGNWFLVTVTNTAAHAFPAPINAASGRMITLTLFNGTAGAIATATFAATYRVSAYVAPGVGFMTSAQFLSNGADWYQVAPWTQIAP
jgi:hypothetical protein